ncbi:hypothetical protein ACOME3_005464 [Neoechinorhynchus agilis]
MIADAVSEIFEKDPDIFRSGTFELLQMLVGMRIPVLIVSAGLGDVIERMLEIATGSTLKVDRSLSIAANYIEFNDEGLALHADFRSYSSRIIHSLNKHECISEWINKNERIIGDLFDNRENCIILGDCVGDVRVYEVDHWDSVEPVLKIGFLPPTGCAEHYLKYFDLLIIEDGDMSVVLDIVKYLVNQSTGPKNN